MGRQRNLTVVYGSNVFNVSPKALKGFLEAARTGSSQSLGEPKAVDVTVPFELSPASAEALLEELFGPSAPESEPVSPELARELL
jgi:hypothetical protein